MNAQKLADLTVPVTALIAMEAKFPHLPAPCVNVTTIFPDRLELSFHYDDFAAFETWREALNMPPAAVEHHVQGGGTTAVRSVHGRFAGAHVRLVGYAPIPALEPVAAGSGAVS
ncbi:hypothetical protein ABZ621_23500 [Streptomyces sp. NPDC007863]|uniref:hypothetical protein n=1 Tax=Streptomyces sp. NPDC007863 TaxID=3154894 RepID=UPI0033C97EB7